MLSTKDLVFKERPTKKLTERYVGPYVIEEVVSTKCGEIAITIVNEDSSGSQHEQDSVI